MWNSFNSNNSAKQSQHIANQQPCSVLWEWSTWQRAGRHQQISHLWWPMSAEKYIRRPTCRRANVQTAALISKTIAKDMLSSAMSWVWVPKSLMEFLQAEYTVPLKRKITALLETLNDDNSPELRTHLTLHYISSWDVECYSADQSDAWRL